jgi:hypothetical protein
MDGLFAIRAIALTSWLLGCALVVWKHQRATAVLRNFFCEPSTPINLALVRIIVFGTLFLSAKESDATWLSSLPREFQHFPRGWVWLADTGIFAPSVVHLAQMSLLLGAALALVGAFTTLSSVIASLSALLVFGVENSYFKIGHSLHVPVLCACVLSASPCGDALSVDALWRRWKRLPNFTASTVYTLPVRFCWMLVGTMYLFPGLWKLWETGDQWLDGSKLVYEMFDKWAQLPDFHPKYRFDQQPFLLAFLGTGTLVLEVGFFFLLFARGTRVAAALFASCFHIGIGLTLDIWFSPFVPLILLADFPEVLALRPLRPLARKIEQLRARWPASFEGAKDRPTATRDLRWAAAASVVGGLWLAGMFAAGVAPIDSWPIAVYPRFAERKSSPTSTGMNLGIFLVRSAGSTVELPNALDALGDSAATYRVARTVVRARHKNDRKTLGQYERLFVMAAERVHGPLQAGEQLRVLSYEFPADPNERSDRGEGSLVLETDPVQP